MQAVGRLDELDVRARPLGPPREQPRTGVDAGQVAGRRVDRDERVEALQEAVGRHRDAHYDRLAAVMGFESVWLAPRGTLA